jgi:hypothetical protein
MEDHTLTDGRSHPAGTAAVEPIPPPTACGGRSLVLLILLLALLLTGLNACKPLHVDDTTYCLFAHQIAAHPLDPYGFSILYFSDPLPALHVLAPPVLPVWWACAIRLFGESPVLWKLWLFPFALLFTASLANLLRRFAPSSALPLLLLTVLSPVFLPSLNLMIDMPALALSLTSLALFFRACDRASVRTSICAGLIAGLAMQTKYTGFLAPAVMLGYAFLFGRLRLGGIAAASAALVFVSWEWFLICRYGESHFLYHVANTPSTLEIKLSLIPLLFPILGAVAPSLFLLALTIGRVSRLTLLLAVVLVVLPYALVAGFDPVLVDFGYDYLPLTGALFPITGAAMLFSVAAVAWRLLHPVRGEPMSSPLSPSGRTAWFLILWVILELLGYFALSPFAAVRRIMGFVAASTLLLGFFAEQYPLTQSRKTVMHGIVAVTVFLGVVYWLVDYVEARAEQKAAYLALDRIREEESLHDVWYTGYWGFQYYAEEVGMKQAVPLLEATESAQLLPPTHFHRGDWLVVPTEAIPQQALDLSGPEFELKDTLYLTDEVPLRTLIYYYSGAPPLRYRRGPRLDVRLFRIRSDCIARLPP